MLWSSSYDLFSGIWSSLHRSIAPSLDRSIAHRCWNAKHVPWCFSTLPWPYQGCCMAVAEDFMQSVMFRSNLRSLRKELNKTNESLLFFERRIGESADRAPPARNRPQLGARAKVHASPQGKHKSTTSPWAALDVGSYGADENESSESLAHELDHGEEDYGAYGNWNAGYGEQADREQGWVSEQVIKYGPDTTPCRGRERWIDPYQHNYRSTGSSSQAYHADDEPADTSLDTTKGHSFFNRGGINVIFPTSLRTHSHTAWYIQEARVPRLKYIRTRICVRGKYWNHRELIVFCISIMNNYYSLATCYQNH